MVAAAAIAVETEGIAAEIVIEAKSVRFKNEKAADSASSLGI